MDVDKVKEFIELMKTHDLSELEIVDGQTRIILKRGAGPAAMPMATEAPVRLGNSSVVPSAAETTAAAAHAEVTAKESPAEQDNLVEITSPLVGTFYTAPSPNADPYVEVDAAVEEDTVVGIVEAMKVMNEIKAQMTGVIRKILVSNGQSVEYGQGLFLVEPT